MACGVGTGSSAATWQHVTTADKKEAAVGYTS
jgi:hypothetical protein